MARFTERQRRFVTEYIIDGNAAAAALRAGYSKKTARHIGYQLLQKPHIQDEIDATLADLRKSRIADIQEILEFLTAVMRGEATEEVLVVIKTGGGKSEARFVTKDPSISDRLRAAEDLGKRLGLFTGKYEVECKVPVVIVDDMLLEG